MTRPASLIDVVTRWRWFANGWIRRPVLGLALIVAAVFALFPRVYVSDVKIAPQDTDTAGLGSIVAQLGGNFAALLGQHQPVEINLAIGRSYEVQADVAQRLGMTDGKDPVEVREAVEDLERRVDVRALRAGILEIEVRGHDAGEVLKTADLYTEVMQERLAALSRRETEYKEGVLNKRMIAAQERLQNAKAAITAYRNRNNLITPEEQMKDAVSALSALRSQKQAAEVELARLRRTLTDQNFAVQTVLGEISGLNRQIALAESRVTAGNSKTASSLAPLALEFERLNLDLEFAQSVYDSYARYFEGTAIEQLTADYNIQIIEEPHLQLGWHFNSLPAIAFVILLLIAMAAEFLYFRPPPGLRPVAE